MQQSLFTWLAAEYHVPLLYSCRVPMSSTSSTLALPAPGPATVRLALIRTGLELYGLAHTRDMLFPVIRMMHVQIRPPEQVALTAQMVHAYKSEEHAGKEQRQTAPIVREMAHADGPFTLYAQVPTEQRMHWEALFQAIGYWGQTDSLAWCMKVSQSEPNRKECVAPLVQWTSKGPIGRFFVSFLTEFRDTSLSWDEIMPMVGSQQKEILRLDLWVWPLVIVEQHGRGKRLQRQAFL